MEHRLRVCKSQVDDGFADGDRTQKFPKERMQRIIAEMFADSLEGVVVDGTPLNEWSSDFDLECEFTLRCDDGVLFRVMDGPSTSRSLNPKQECKVTNSRSAHCLDVEHIPSLKRHGRGGQDRTN